MCKPLLFPATPKFAILSDMGNYTLENQKHWEALPARAIIGRNAFPGTELFKYLSSGAHVLDLGCGTGEISELLTTHGYRVTAIDTNIEAIDLGKSKSTSVDYVLGDITKRLPFEDQSFDAIVISFVLVSIISQSDRERLVSELIRVSKIGGFVWLNEALISDDYTKRYELSQQFLKSNDHDFFVFQEGTASASIQTPEALGQAIKENRVARIAHHFSTSELEQLFERYDPMYTKQSETASPNSKSVIKMVIIVFRLKAE